MSHIRSMQTNLRADCRKAVHQLSMGATTLPPHIRGQTDRNGGSTGRQLVFVVYVVVMGVVIVVIVSGALIMR